jgi:hypothetical protein
MVRQARKYLMGALSGASLIAIAIVVFVALVTTQVFTDWPIAALGKGDNGSVSDSRAVEAGSTAATGAESSGGTGGGANGTGTTGGGGGGGKTSQKQGGGGGGQLGGAGGGGEGAGTGEGGGSTPEAAPGGGGSGGGSIPAGGEGASGSSGSTSGGSGSGSGGGGETTTASTPSGKVTSTVNETVHQVDETVTGGTLEQTGVTQTTEEVVNGVAGPESTVGKVVDETVGTLEGTLGQK